MVVGEDITRTIIDAFTQLTQEFSERLAKFETDSKEASVQYLFAHITSAAANLLEIVPDPKARDYIRDIVAAAGKAWLMACMTRKPGSKYDTLPVAIEDVTGAYERLGIGLPQSLPQVSQSH